MFANVNVLSAISQLIIDLMIILIMLVMNAGLICDSRTLCSEQFG